MISVDFENVFCSKHGKWLAKEVGLFCPATRMRKHIVFSRKEFLEYGKSPYHPMLRVAYSLSNYNTLLKYVPMILTRSKPVLVYDTALDLQVLRTIGIDEADIIDVSRLVADRVGQRVTLHVALLAFGVEHERRSLHNPFADSMYTYRLWEKLDGK